MKKILLSAGMLCATLFANAQCEPQTTLNEDFTDFTIGTTGVFPQNCWSSISGATRIYTAETESNKYAVFYSLFAVNTDAYLISPEVSNFDGAHQLSFDAYKLGMGGSVPSGTVSLQVGTISDVADAATFVAFGDVITITTADVETYNNIIIPSAPAGSHIAFKLSADSVHNALAIDNVVWDAVPAPACAAVETLNEDFSNFTIATTGAFPQNCWSASAGMPLVYTGETEDETNQYAVFYSLFAANAPGYLVTPEVSTIDGAHQLSFDTYKLAANGVIPEGNITVQIGTLTSASDFTTFTAVGEPITVTDTSVNHANIVIPASTTQGFIAFKITADAIHNGAAIDNVVWEAVPEPACVAVETLNEDFSNFTIATTGAFPQNCWSASTGMPLVYTGETEDETNQYAVFYSLFAANAPGYLVTPEVSTIDGAHELSFDTYKLAANGVIPEGNITVQIGTLTSASDFTTFTAVGEPIAVTDTSVNHANIVIPASTTQGFIAFKITADAIHNGAAIDNVVWEAVTAGTGTIKANNFSVYPNPTSNKNVTLTYNNLDNGHVSVYSLTGAKVYETTVSGTSKNINLSALSAGMYVIKLESGNISASQKLIVQ